jgi:hypothetical protein
MIGEQLEEIGSTTPQIYARNLDPSGRVSFPGFAILRSSDRHLY